MIQGPVCEIESGLPMGATTTCSGTVTAPESLSPGAYFVRFWVNPSDRRAGTRFVAEGNWDNNRFFVQATATRPGGTPGGSLWEGNLRFEGQMTLNGRTAPATIDIFDGILAGQVNGFEQSNTFIMSFTNNAGPTITGNKISYPIRSDSLILGTTVYGGGTGTFSLTMDERRVGSSASGTIDVTYGDTRLLGAFTGALAEVEP